MTSQQLELIARRGLTLPEPTLTRLRTVGIWCEANLTVQRRDQDWLIRGQESGGAVNDIGRYVSFCKEDGSALSLAATGEELHAQRPARDPADKRADRTIGHVPLRNRL
jgi:hypothetical protein